jgi:channel protein (hemolysin III family)
VYEHWEVAADGVVHLLSLTWASVSVGVLLSASTAPRFCVYSACVLLIFCTSAAYNMVGCALQSCTGVLRRVDQASIFVAAGGMYTVFAWDRAWLLATVWAVCGTGALLKLALGIRVERTALAAYAFLAVAPLALVQPSARAYPTLIGCFLALVLGVTLGYMNNHKGGMAFWHACVLAASVAYWTLVYGAAQHGAAYYL